MQLDLEPGMILIHGANGEGKSNLLEALYMVAIAKSPKASAERELVRRQAAREGAQAQVFAMALRDGGRVRVQIDLTPTSQVPDPSAEALPVNAQGHPQRGGESGPVQKHVKVNGVPRLTSELVGEINAVMFSAQDLDLVLGPPVVRRRYLDILISQLDRRYLRTLQRYQRVVSQRNHLLKILRHGRSQQSELEFWDDELVGTGSYIMARRAETVLVLSQRAGPIHWELTGDSEALELDYRPSVETDAGVSEEGLAKSLRRSMELQREREVAQGFTVCGPHRDDLQMLLDDMDAALYASRGQCRTAVLAMKLAEAGYLRERRGQEPVLLLDDVLSELDAGRRSQVLDRVSRYEQCFITTTDVDSIDAAYLSRMVRFVVSGGRVTPEGEATGVDS